MSVYIRDNITKLVIGAGALAAISVYSYNFYLKRKNKVTRIIDTIEAFKKSVHMKDPDHVEEIVSTLIKGGPSRLQVLSDFDFTISRTHRNGIKCTTSFGILETGPLSSEETRHQCNLLFDYYHPIEMDVNLSVEEKLPLIKEWYAKSIGILVKAGLRKNDIEEMVRLTSSVLRDGCDLLFHSLYTHDVPFLVFSAGVGDVLKEMIKQQGLLYPNVKIIANYLDFDEKGNVVGFKGDLINTFNKKDFALCNSDYFDNLKQRSNVILLGDSISDLDMAEGIKDLNCILRIGFLNTKVQESLARYMQCFDIVLVDDQSMDLVNSILQHIL